MSLYSFLSKGRISLGRHVSWDSLMIDGQLRSVRNDEDSHNKALVWRYSWHFKRWLTTLGLCGFSILILVCSKGDDSNIPLDLGVGSRNYWGRGFILALCKTLVTCLTSKRRTFNSSLIDSVGVEGYKLWITVLIGLYSLRNLIRFTDLKIFFLAWLFCCLVTGELGVHRERRRSGFFCKYSLKSIDRVSDAPLLIYFPSLIGVTRMALLLCFA